MHPSTVADLLRALQPEPGRPRLTWYGSGGERVELSGAVLENWVAKTANLLVEELDAAPGARVVLDLPPHWRTVLWALATWRTGACVVAAEPGGAAADGADAVVTDRPGPWGTAVPVVAVTLPALARRYDGELPPRAIDAAAAVMTYGDVLGWVPDLDPTADALVADGLRVAHRDLLTWAGAPGAPGARTLVTAPDGPGRAAATVTFARSTLAVLGGAGSVVALSAEVARELAADPARRTRVLSSERVEVEAPLG
ncbi:TIGR03089 family protein [Cellulomonas sp. NPDC055163]